MKREFFVMIWSCLHGYPGKDDALTVFYPLFYNLLDCQGRFWRWFCFWSWSITNSYRSIHNTKSCPWPICNTKPACPWIFIWAPIIWVRDIYANLSPTKFSSKQLWVWPEWHTNEEQSQSGIWRLICPTTSNAFLINLLLVRF